ncbi:MAG: hypothetical protein JWP81_787 [Ferruginibacter sp.]|nr:hypothetical protein [Ferruginibacter sp.]
MISSRLLPVCILTAALFFSSCGGNEQKSTTETTSSDSTTTTTATTESVAPSTIVTTPQGMLLVTHKVGNFTKWKASYDAHDSMRLANGIHSYVIGRSVEDSSMVFVATKADDIAKAKAFGANPSLKQAMQKGGVMGKPTVSPVIITWQDTAVVNSPLRSMTTFTVKDWDAWQKAFADGKQERMDNGIVDRAYGHDADDNKKITLVTALTDTAKAGAYWKSDMLKKRREAGGVIGQPARFVFHIVQRY